VAGAIGEPLDRVDGRLKVTGQAVYTADWQIPDMAHAVLLTSRVAAGRIASIDTQAARQVSGVIAVLTHEDRLPLAQDPSKVRQGEPSDRALQLLQDDRVLYAGQPVAIAIGETLEAANEAAAKIVVHYEARQPSITFADALRRSYVPEKAGGGKDPGEKARGDFQRAMADAPVKVENIYSTPFQTHNPMEPHATIAVWDGPDKLTLYDTSQGIFGDRERVAGLLGIDPANLRVVCLYVGGGFGSKGPTWSHSPLCAMAARQVGRPVKLVVRRPQMFGPVGCRTETQQTISLGAMGDGKLQALSNETYTHTSTFDEFTETATLPSRMLYSVPNNYTVQRLIRSDIGTPSYMRAPGEAPGTFALEIAMDELAYRLGLDPVELRLRNYAEQDEDKNLPWSTKSLRECYERGAERFGWSKRNPEPRSMRLGRTLIGWGMATATYPARRSPASAVARMYPDGSVHVDAGSQDLGTGTYTIMTQIAADAVGVPVSDVVFRLGDTRFPETPVSGGSQTAATCGTAVFKAARALRDRIRSMGSPGAPLREIVAGAGKPYIEAKASSGENEDAKKFSSYSFGAQFAEVHVDADVGQIHVARMTGVFAAGKILNAKTARSQFMGGMVWGISLALHEHSAYDRRLGRMVNNNLAEYHVPVNADVGEIDVSWVEEDDRHVSAVGAKGIGEIGITGSAAAVANAIYHATGRRIREAPITPDRLIV
jgi:xanthine dehydrogenase YagR molybdenum-binding subunit